MPQSFTSPSQNANMDFLDPRKKRLHHIQLRIGYGLLAVAIGLGTLVLVYGAYGYSLNTKNGSVIENGLLFVDSKPGGANIYLNGKGQSSSTSARLVLQSGSYSLKLTKSGYRDWQRKLVLDEHAIARYVYPFLFPVSPKVTSLKSYAAQPGLVTQTPDRRWLVVQTATADNAVASFDVYDTSKLKPSATILNISIDLLTAPDQASTFKDIEWSSDNNHLLLERSYSGGSEFLMLDRQDSASSVNLTKLFKSSPFSLAALRDKKADQLYLYDAAAQTLQIGNVTSGVVAPPILDHVLAFKPYGSNLLVYVTDSGMPAGQVQARIWDSAKSYVLYNFLAGSTYLIDTAQFQGHSYFVAGSSGDERVNLYKDPLNDLQNSATGKAHPFITLRENSASKVSFSANARFVALQAGQNLAVYDLETISYYRYQLKPVVDGALGWMDGHRLFGASAGHIFVMDYDSTNQQILSATTLTGGGVFDRAYNHLFTTTAGTTASQVDLQSIDMRAGVDLPKQ